VPGGADGGRSEVHVDAPDEVRAARGPARFAQAGCGQQPE